MRLVYAVAQHLHMTAGAVLDSMGANELMCWHYLLTERSAAQQQAAGDEPVELSVEDEIAAWGG
jgi:hypothetical protein